MIFGWEGFWFTHPDDWAPATLTGTRDMGYVRIASGGKMACQVRWKKAESARDLEKRLDAYLAKLKKDSKGSFDYGTEPTPLYLRYYYSGDLTGKGALFFDELSKRVFFIEISAAGNARLGTPLKEILGSFGSGKERWAMFGLDVCLPEPVKPEKKVLLSGRTQLLFGRRGVSVEAQRWAFGKQLIDKHGLEPWSRAALGMKKADAEVEDGRIAFTQSRLSKVFALSKFEEDRNQIVTLKVRSRQKKWRPEWDWLN